MMRRTKRISRGQSTAEYAIVIALVLGAAIAMQTFVRRTIQGRVADGASSMPLINISQPLGGTVNRPAALAGNNTLFEPGYASSISNANTNVVGNAALAGTKGSTSNVTYDASTISNRNGVSVEAGAN